MGNLSLEDSTSTLHRVVNSNVYLVEKMLRKKGDKIYMKWLGFDNSTLIYKRIVCYKNKIYYKLYNYWEYALILKDFQEMAQLATIASSYIFVPSKHHGFSFQYVSFCRSVNNIIFLSIEYVVLCQ